MVAYLQQKYIFVFNENIFKEKYLTFKKKYSYSMKYICIQQKILILNEKYLIFKKIYLYSIKYIYIERKIIFIQ